MPRMTTTLPPDVRAWLETQAERSQMTPERLAARLLYDQFRAATAPPTAKASGCEYCDVCYCPLNGEAEGCPAERLKLTVLEGGQPH